jgi:hypothetical protein
MISRPLASFGFDARFRAPKAKYLDCGKLLCIILLQSRPILLYREFLCKAYFCLNTFSYEDRKA